VSPHLHQDPQLEAGLLAHVLLDNQAIDEVADVVEEGDFGTSAAALAFAAMVRLRGAGAPIDLLTLRSELQAVGALERVGEPYLLQLHDHIPTGASAEHYARRIRGLSAVRAVLTTAREIQVRGSGPIEDPAAFIAEAEAAMSAAARSRAESRGLVSMRGAVRETVQRLVESAARMQEGGKPDGAVATRFSRLNGILGGGFRPGELHILAGRPGMGKTAIALDLALSMHVSPGIVFSLEMSRDELARRALSSEGRIDGGRMRLVTMAREDWERLQAAAVTLAERGVFIDDTPGATISHIRSESRRQKARGGLAWMLIDYLQLMAPDDRGKSREEQVGAISRGLKALARELDVPVIALAQLNRDLEKRPVADRRPKLSDLRDSGSIEQDADSVLFIYREEVYRRDAMEVKGLGELLVGKQRAGPTGRVNLRFFPEYTRFEELGDDSRYTSAPAETAGDADGDFADFQDEGAFR